MIFDKLGRTQSQKQLNDLRRLSEERIEETLKDYANKSYHYFKNDMLGIEYYLTEYLKTIINPNVLNKMKLVIINYVPRIVKRLSIVYKKPPVIKLSSGEDAYKENTFGLNKKRKEFHRQAKLLNTILVRPIWDANKKIFNYTILHRGICDVVTDSQTNELQQLKYSVEITKGGEPEIVDIYWTAENHWATDKKGKPILLDGMPADGVNPYGVIPFVILRLEDSADFWGDGLIDVVNGNEALNGRLTDTFYKLYMSFGVPLGTNLGIKSEDFYISPTTGIMIDDVKVNQQPPDLRFITPEQKVELDKVVNDWVKTELASSKGLPTSNIRYTSGFDRMVDNLELLELNEDDKEVLREFEFNLFEMMQIVGSVDGAGISWLKSKMLSVEFMPIEYPKTTEEVWLNRENEYKYHISSPKDWIKEDMPDLTDEEIDEIIKQNKKLNDELKTPTQPEVTSLLDKFRTVR